MAITASAKKAHKQSLKKRVFNDRRSRAMKSVTKEIKKLVQGKEVAKAQELLPKAYKAIDKAAKGNTIKANTASRKKSRLAGLIKRSK